MSGIKGQGVRYTVEQFAKAIPGSGGLMSIIAKKVGCDFHTAKKWIERHPTLLIAYENECGNIDDTAEANVIRVIKEGDVERSQWWLTKRRKGRFGNSASVNLSMVDLTKLSTEQLERIAAGEDVSAVLLATTDTGAG